MVETRHFGLPLLASGQAQKHVTVNEALARLDALVSGVVESASREAPPMAADGDVFIVPVGAGSAWGVAETMLAVFLNGGWVAVAPIEGRAVWVRDEDRELRFSSGAWAPIEATADPEAPGPGLEAVSIDVALAATSQVETAPIIPGSSVVFGVTARVIEAVAGVDSWRLGVPQAESRYGVGHATQVGATAIGMTGAPVAYLEETPLVITAEGGAFVGGLLRLSIQCIRLAPPEAT